jgi:hypothetical protein
MDVQYSPAEGDCWVRHLLESSAIRTTEPRIRDGYLAKELVPVKDKPWQAEISGRLLSLAFDWRDAAAREERLIGQSHIRFRGMAFVDTSDLLAAGPPNFSVLADATLWDWAHANLVAWRAPLAEVDADAPERPERVSQEVARSLARLLKLAETQGQLNDLESRRSALDCTRPWSRAVRKILCKAIYAFRFVRRRIRRRKR